MQLPLNLSIIFFFLSVAKQIQSPCTSFHLHSLSNLDERNENFDIMRDTHIEQTLQVMIFCLQIVGEEDKGAIMGTCLPWGQEAHGLAILHISNAPITMHSWLSDHNLVGESHGGPPLCPTWGHVRELPARQYSKILWRKTSGDIGKTVHVIRSSFYKDLKSDHLPSMATKSRVISVLALFRNLS